MMDSLHRHAGSPSTTEAPGANHMQHIQPYIYVSDPATYQLLYCNDALKAALGLKSYKGRKCWDVLRQQCGPCELCPAQALRHSSSDTVLWEEYILPEQRVFRNINSFIPHGDQMHHMHYSFDITASNATQGKRLARAYTLYNIAMNFILRNSVEDSLASSISMLGAYMHAHNVRIFQAERENNIFSCTSEWHNREHIAKAINRLTLNSDVYYTLVNNECSILDASTTDVAELRYLARELDSVSFACSPIIVDGQLWGFIEVDFGSQHYSWTATDVGTIGTITSILAAGIARLSVEEKLLAAQETLRIIFDNVPSCIFWKDKNSVYKQCNTAFGEMFGISPKFIAGKTDHYLFNGRFVQNVLHSDQVIIKQAKPSTRRIEKLTHPSGEEKWISISKLPIKNEWGEVTYVLGIAEDITRERETKLQIAQRDRELKRAIESEQKANRAKSNFLSNISHEMRTPLHAILGMTHIAQEAANNEKTRYCLEMIEVASTNLLSSINDVLDISKIEANKLELSCEEFNLEKLVMDALRVIQVSADNKKIPVHANVQQDVWHNYIGDEKRLGQIFINILSNAVKFTPVGGSIVLELHAMESTDQHTVLECHVTDTGIGLDENTKSRIFEPFEQADSGISRQYGGTGLGMAIVKNIVEHMHGHIDVESTPGQGSRFTFTVRLKNAPTNQGPQLATPLQGRKLRILLAGQEAQGIAQYSRFLGKHTEFTQAANQSELKRIYTKGKQSGKRFDIIFIDMSIVDVSDKRLGEACRHHNVVLVLSPTRIDDVSWLVDKHYVRKLLPSPLFPTLVVSAINELLCQKCPDEQSLPNLSDKRILLVEDVEINKEIMQEFLSKTHVQIDWAPNGAIALNMFVENKAGYDLDSVDNRNMV